MAPMRSIPAPIAAGLWAAGLQVTGLLAAPPVQAQPAPNQPAAALHEHRHHPEAHRHSHDLGPAGRTYDLRFLDAMVQHHTGALRMAEVVFDIGEPGVGALAKQIWRDQAQEIKAMGQWRRAWYPQAPVTPVVLRPEGNPDALSSLVPMDADTLAAMRMVGPAPSPETRVVWFLEGMLHHHGAALLMAHDALARSSNPTIRRLARTIITNQRQEIRQLRAMLAHGGLRKADYHRYDDLFRF